MIVFDSSTLILLAKIEILDVLLKDYDADIVIPSMVERECTIKGSFDALLIKKRVEEGKIKVTALEEKGVEKIMQDFNVNIGEAEAIALALKSKNAVLATDDKNAINACKLLRLPFTTAIDFLVRAKEKNLLTQEEALVKLAELSKYGRYKQEITDDVRKKFKGGK